MLHRRSPLLVYSTLLLAGAAAPAAGESPRRPPLSCPADHELVQLDSRGAELGDLRLGRTDRGHLALWTEVGWGQARGTLRMATISSDGRVEPRAVPAALPRHLFYSDLVSGPQSVMVIDHDRSGPRAVVLDDQGAVVSELASPAPTGRALDVDAAFDGRHYRVAWLTSTATGATVHVARYDERGVAVGPPWLAVATTSAAPARVRVTHTGPVTWILWSEQRATYGVRIAADGTVLDPAPRSVAAGEAYAVASIGDTALLLSARARESFATMLSADGARASSPFRPLPTLPDTVDLQATPANGGYLYWVRHVGELRGAPLSSDGRPRSARFYEHRVASSVAAVSERGDTPSGAVIVSDHTLDGTTDTAHLVAFEGDDEHRVAFACARVDHAYDCKLIVEYEPYDPGCRASPGGAGLAAGAIAVLALRIRRRARSR